VPPGLLSLVIRTDSDGFTSAELFNPKVDRATDVPHARRFHGKRRLLTVRSAAGPTYGPCCSRRLPVTDLPSWLCGFDSRHPLQPETAGGPAPHWSCRVCENQPGGWPGHTRPHVTHFPPPFRRGRCRLGVRAWRATQPSALAMAWSRSRVACWKCRPGTPAATHALLHIRTCAVAHPWGR